MSGDDLVAGSFEIRTRGDTTVLAHTVDQPFDGPEHVVDTAGLAARHGASFATETAALAPDVAGQEAIDGGRVGEVMLRVFADASNPRLFFDNLRAAGVLDAAIPEVAALDGLPAGPEGTHEEGDSFEHTMQVVTAMQEIRPNDVDALLAALGHDLGKGATSDDVLPSHHGHAKRGVDVAARLAERLALPSNRRGAMQVGSRQHMRLHGIRDLNATTVLDMAKRVSDSPLSVDQLVAVGQADALGREPTRPFYADEAREKLATAQAVLADVGPEESLARRDMDREATSDEKVENIVRQDRAEEFRDRL